MRKPHPTSNRHCRSTHATLEAYQSLGIVCKHTGKNDEAIDNLKKALNVNANLPLADEWLGRSTWRTVKSTLR